MMKTSKFGFSERLGRLVRRGAADLMCASGYRAIGRRFVQVARGVVRIIQVDRMHERQGEPRCRYRIVAGVFVPGFLEARGEAAPRGFGHFADLPVHGIGPALPGATCPRWWTLSPDDDVELRDVRLAHDLGAFVFDVAAPFVERFATPQDVLAYLEAPRPDVEERVSPLEGEHLALNLAGMQHLLGRRTAAEETLRAALQEMRALGDHRCSRLLDLLAFLRHGAGVRPAGRTVAPRG